MATLTNLFVAGVLLLLNNVCWIDGFVPSSTVHKRYPIHPGPLSFPRRRRATTTLLANVGATASLSAITSSSGFCKGLPILGSLFALTYYHVRLIRDETSGARPTWRSVQMNTREEWSKYVRETEGWLYAVQTLRNAITSQTFFTTTVLSLLTVITGKLWGTLQDNLYRQLQFSSIAFCMLRSAYEFSQSARLMTHAGFMFPVTKGTKVDAILRRSSLTQWLGLRWFYISLSALAWTFAGEGAFLLSSLGLVQLFRLIDQVPGEVDGDSR